MDDIVTNDLTRFGRRELALAGELLVAYAQCRELDDILTDGVQVWFNTHSGYVFLSDEDFNVVMMNPETDRAEQWFNCPYCGHEGFITDMAHDPDADECLKYLDSIEAPGRIVGHCDVCGHPWRDNDDECLKCNLTNSFRRWDE